MKYLSDKFNGIKREIYIVLYIMVLACIIFDFLDILDDLLRYYWER